MDLALTGKNVVVTGGSRGIGRAIAQAFAAEGANLALCARQEGPLQAAAEEIRAQGVAVWAAPCDVSDTPALHRFLEGAREALGSIDVLVNNASALAFNDDDEGWQASLNVDLLAPVNASKKVIPWMKEAGGGCLLFISSISGLEAGSPPGYAAAKAALISYSKTMAIELAPHGIRVNTVAPGSIEFEGGLWAHAKEGNPPLYNMILGSIPSGRLGTPEEVANLVVFLASARASWITGECVLVDGGQRKANV